MRSKDRIYNAMTYISAFLGTFVLGSILVFTFPKGFSSLSWSMITGDYWSANYVANVEENYTEAVVSSNVVDVKGYYSEKWGIAVDDTLSNKREKQLEVTYISPDSPFGHLLNATAGENLGKSLSLDVGYSIEKIDYEDADGSIKLAGKIMGQDAKTTIEALESAKTITGVYFKSSSGGIRGSLIATLYLILISLVLSLPIGIASAIYLNEYAGPTKIN